MLLNKGGGIFEDVTQQTGTVGSQNTFHGTFVDLDNNGNQDLVLANNTGAVEIYKSNGNLDFEKQAIDSDLGFWMGVGIGDVDKDGNQELFFPNTGSTIPDNLLRGGLRDDQTVGAEWLLLDNDGNWNLQDMTKNIA